VLEQFHLPRLLACRTPVRLLIVLLILAVVSVAILTLIQADEPDAQAPENNQPHDTLTPAEEPAAASEFMLPEPTAQPNRVLPEIAYHLQIHAELGQFVKASLVSDSEDSQTQEIETTLGNYIFTVKNFHVTKVKILSQDPPLSPYCETLRHKEIFALLWLAKYAMIRTGDSLDTVEGILGMKGFTWYDRDSLRIVSWGWADSRGSIEVYFRVISDSQTRALSQNRRIDRSYLTLGSCPCGGSPDFFYREVFESIAVGQFGDDEETINNILSASPSVISDSKFARVLKWDRGSRSITVALRPGELGKLRASEKSQMNLPSFGQF